MLIYQLSVRTKRICTKIDDDPIQGESGAHAVFQAMFKHGGLSIVSTIYSEFQALLHSKRGDKGIFKNVEALFDTYVRKA